MTLPTWTAAQLETIHQVVASCERFGFSNSFTAGLLGNMVHESDLCCGYPQSSSSRSNSLDSVWSASQGCTPGGAESVGFSSTTDREEVLRTPEEADARVNKPPPVITVITAASPREDDAPPATGGCSKFKGYGLLYFIGPLKDAYFRFCQRLSESEKLQQAITNSSFPVPDFTSVGHGFVPTCGTPLAATVDSENPEWQVAFMYACLHEEEYMHAVGYAVALQLRSLSTVNTPPSEACLAIASLLLRPNRTQANNGRRVRFAKYFYSHLGNFRENGPQDEHGDNNNNSSQKGTDASGSGDNSRGDESSSPSFWTCTMGNAREQQRGMKAPGVQSRYVDAVSTVSLEVPPQLTHPDTPTCVTRTRCFSSADVSGNSPFLGCSYRVDARDFLDVARDGLPLSRSCSECTQEARSSSAISTHDEGTCNDFGRQVAGDDGVTITFDFA